MFHFVDVSLFFWRILLKLRKNSLLISSSGIMPNFAGCLFTINAKHYLSRLVVKKAKKVTHVLRLAVGVGHTEPDVGHTELSIAMINVFWCQSFVQSKKGVLMKELLLG